MPEKKPEEGESQRAGERARVRGNLELDPDLDLDFVVNANAHKPPSGGLPGAPLMPLHPGCPGMHAYPCHDTAHLQTRAHRCSQS